MTQTKPDVHQSFKEKAVRELKEFWIISVFLALVFGGFIWYKRLILREFEITYLHYGFALVEALIIAKVILIGRALGLGRKFEDGPLIVAALFKAVVYGAFVAVFSVFEHIIEGILHHQDWSKVLADLNGPDKYEMLARAVVVIITFIPFFAFQEMGRVLGEEKLFALFFKRRPS